MIGAEMFSIFRRKPQPQPHIWTKWEIFPKVQRGINASFNGSVMEVQRRSCERCGLVQEASLSVYGTSCDADNPDDAMLEAIVD